MVLGCCPQSICTAGSFVQWGPHLSSSACEQSAVLCIALGHAQATFPGRLGLSPLPPTSVLICAHVHTHRLAISSSPSSPATTLASHHWYWCQYSEGQDADCPVLDLHVLSFDVF